VALQWWAVCHHLPHPCCLFALISYSFRFDLGALSLLPLTCAGTWIHLLLWDQATWWNVHCT
jgi:hypothetical protein